MCILTLYSYILQVWRNHDRINPSSFDGGFFADHSNCVMWQVRYVIETQPFCFPNQLNVVLGCLAWYFLQNQGLGNSMQIWGDM